MTDASFSAEDIAHFLQENPEFFQEHADVFANMHVPHPHETRAISLGERQIMALRTRAKDLEWKLAGLMRNASGNERSEEHTSELQSLMRISYAVFCLKKNK